MKKVGRCFSQSSTVSKGTQSQRENHHGFKMQPQKGSFKVLILRTKSTQAMLNCLEKCETGQMVVPGFFRKSVFFVILAKKNIHLKSYTVRSDVEERAAEERLA